MVARVVHERADLVLAPGDDGFETRQLLVGVTGRVRVHWRAVHRDRRKIDQPSTTAKGQHLHEQLAQRVVVTLDEPGDGGMVHCAVRGDDPAAEIVPAGPLDAPRGAYALAVAVEDQRDQGCWRVGAAALPVSTVAVLEGRKIELLDHIEHFPTQVPWRQPLPGTPRHLEITFAVARQETPPTGPDSNVPPPTGTERRIALDSRPGEVVRQPPCRRAEVPEPAPDPGGGEFVRRQRLLPRPPEVCGEGPGEAELGVVGEPRPDACASPPGTACAPTSPPPTNVYPSVRRGHALSTPTTRPCASCGRPRAAGAAQCAVAAGAGAPAAARHPASAG